MCHYYGSVFQFYSHICHFIFLHRAFCTINVMSPYRIFIIKLNFVVMLILQLSYYFAPGRGAKYCNECAYLSVCSHISKTTRLFYKIFCTLLSGAVSPSSWQQWSTLRTSGFVDDVMFSIMSPMACAVGSIYVSTMLEQVVVSFQSILQVVAHCLTWQQSGHRGQSLLFTTALFNVC